MNDFLRYARNLSIFCFLAGGIASLGIYLYDPTRWMWSVGLLIGIVAGVISLRVMVMGITQMSTPAEAKPGTLMKYNLIRYAITGIALGVSFYCGRGAMGWPTLIGLLFPNLLLGLDGFLRPAGPAPTEATEEGAA